MNNRQGTINEQLSYWKGQKKHLNNEGAYDYKLNCNPKGASPILDQKQKRLHHFKSRNGTANPKL